MAWYSSFFGSSKSKSPSKKKSSSSSKPKYNQNYWASQRAKGVSQADMAAEQDRIGMKKAYSGDQVVTEDMSRKANDDLKRVTGSMATLQNKGVTKSTEKSGLFGEKSTTTYDYKGGPSIVQKANDPVIAGLRLGDKKSTTFVDGVEMATKTGQGALGLDAKVTKPDIAGHITDTVKASPKAIPTDDIETVNEQIKTETDPVKLKALYQRRLSLMRAMGTRTRWSNPLGIADVKQSNLLGIL